MRRTSEDIAYEVEGRGWQGRVDIQHADANSMELCCGTVSEVVDRRSATALRLSRRETMRRRRQQVRRQIDVVARLFISMKLDTDHIPWLWLKRVRASTEENKCRLEIG